MALAILLLVSLSVITLIVEGMWSTNHKHLGIDENSEPKNVCKGEEKIVKPCHQCTSYDMTLSAAFCGRTGYKEEIRCSDGTTVSRSCKVEPWVEERKFWIFQLITFIVGICSYSLVRYRQSKLDRDLADKVNKQIAA